MGSESGSMRALLLGLLTSVALVAQGPRGDYLLSGTVVNSVTGEPVKAALVSLRDSAAIAAHARELGLRWFLLNPGDRVAWPDEITGRPAFELGGYRLYRF